MDDALLPIALTLLGIATALWLAARRPRHSERELLLRLRAISPGARPDAAGVIAFTFSDRVVYASAEGGVLVLTTPLPPAPLPFPQAARALGDGPLIAALSAPDVDCGGERLSLRVAGPGRRVRALRRELERLVALVAALEAVPQDLALARYLLDHAPEAARLALFETLVTSFAASPETRRCAMALVDDDDPTLREAATRLLEAPAAPHGRGTDSPVGLSP